MEEKRRFTTVHDRFQICDTCCGLVETATTRDEALRIARAHWSEHPGNEVIFVDVFDVMARRGMVTMLRVARDGTYQSV
jgi:hypothetical protein